MYFDLNVSGKSSDDDKWKQIAAEVVRLKSFGATVRAEHPPRCVGMCDPEGDGFDVA